ncbi:MAG: putative oxidoreductase [Saprospiraceae bacterium]|jgi:predicted oxidoreductase
MQKINLSAEGPTFSRIVAGVMSWGVWGADFSVKKTEEYINQCLDLGISTFDHADIYGHYTTEKLFGDATKGSSSLREQMQLVSKCGIKLTTPNRPNHAIKSYDTSKAHIIESVEKSLENLQTDYLDALLIHRPSPLMYPEEIAEAFEQLHEQGKVLHFGVSNFTAAQLDLFSASIPLITNQIEVSLLLRAPMTDGTLDKCLEKGIVPMAWSPMAGGRLFSNEPNEQILRVRKTAAPLQEKYNISLDQLLTAWLLKHPTSIIPVFGSTKIERLKAAVEALDVHLTREEWFSLLEAAEGSEIA